MSPTATRERNWLDALTARVGLGRSGRRRRRDVPCPACGRDNDVLVARWCGHCGHRLTEAIVLADRREQERAQRDPVALRKFGAPIFVVLLGLLMLVPAALQRQEVVPTGHSVRGDGQRTGIVATEAPRPPREVAWEVDGNAPALGFATVESSSGAAVLSRVNRIEVLDLTTGELRAEADLRTTPRGQWDLGRVFGDLVLVPDLQTSVLHARDVATGERRWSQPLGGFPRDAAREALQVGEDVIVPSGIGFLDRIGVADGSVRWGRDLADLEDRGVVSLVGGGVERFTALTVFPPGGQIQQNSAAIPWLAGLDADSGVVRWQQQMLPNDALAPMAANDRLVAHVDSTRGPQAVVVVRDARTGAETASIPVDGSGYDIELLGDLVVVSTSNGVVGWADGGTREAFRAEVDPVPGQLLANTEPLRLVVPVDGALAVLDAGGQVVGRIEGDLEPTADRVRLVDGVVVIAEDDLVASAWDLAGNQLWSRSLRAPHVAGIATDGRLVAATSAAGIVVVDTEDPDGDVARVQQLDDDGFRAPVEGPVAMDDGMVIVSPFGGGPSGRALFSVEAATGLGLWSREGESPPVVGTITRTPGLVWISVEDEIHGYDTDTGRRSFAALAGRERGALAVTPELVIGTPVDGQCAGQDACGGGVVALEIASREIEWDAPAPACGPPAVRDGRVVVPTLDGPWALGISDGGLLWNAAPGTAERHGGGCGALALHTDVVVQGEGRRVSAWDVTTGEGAWTVDLGRTLTTDPVLAGDEVVVGTSDNQLTSLDARTGELLWQFRLPAPALADPVVADGNWVVLLRDGRIVGLR